jgi:hypothetical protein
MIIEELQDRKALLHEFDLLRDEPLLEYVWEVALEFNEAPSTLVGDAKTSFAPTIFANRYAESKLTDEERYARHMEMYPKEESFEEYMEDKYKKLDTSFKDKFLSNQALQYTIEAFGLDVSKLWYLLLFVHDYIEDFGSCKLTLLDTTWQELNKVNTKLEEATEIMLKKNGRKSYVTDRKDIMKVLKTALDYFVNIYSNIMEEDLTEQEKFEKLKGIGLLNYIDDWSHLVNLNINYYLDLSHKKWYFTKIFLFFLKNRKARNLPHVKEKVSTDKYMFISRLIYTVGYHGKEYNKEYNEKGNKNRMLSNLLRKYNNEEFPSIASRYYI